MTQLQETIETGLPDMDDEGFDAMRENAGNAVRLLKSLANESRLVVMCVLAEGEISVGKLNRRIDLSQSALSQHLAILREQGLVKTRRESQTIYYSLSDSDAISLINTLHSIFCADLIIE